MKTLFIFFFIGIALLSGDGASSNHLQEKGANTLATTNFNHFKSGLFSDFDLSTSETDDFESGFHFIECIRSYSKDVVKINIYCARVIFVDKQMAFFFHYDLPPPGANLIG